MVISEECTYIQHGFNFRQKMLIGLTAVYYKAGFMDSNGRLGDEGIVIKSRRSGS